MNTHVIYYTSPFCYPVLSICSLIHTNSQIYSIPYIRHSKELILNNNHEGEKCIISDDFIYISIIWYSIMENTYYAYQNSINLCNYKYQNVLIELIPKGFISILNYSENIGEIIFFDNCINLDSESNLIERHLFNEYYHIVSNVNDLNLLQDKYLNILDCLGYKRNNVINNINIFKHRYRIYNYRYTLLFENWDINQKCCKSQDIIGENIEEFSDILFDGSFNKVLVGNRKFIIRGKPYMIKVKWNDCGNEYYAFFWLNEASISSVFERFYGAHPDTKTDFIIRIDADNKKYELALFRLGLKKPQIIPEDAYQLLVFKNKFEDYRSDNYNQERGAWIW